MNPIRIITASAGSGKTYRLAKELYRAVRSGEARPEAILATTFTVKAASELKQRVRRKLLAAGLCAEAERLGAARFGTVNSVCGRLVDEYAFELGLPPGLSVLDEKAADRAMNRVISSVLTADEEMLAGRLDHAFGEWKWQGLVSDVVARARSNGIGPGAMAGFAERSIESSLSLLGRPEEDGRKLDDTLKEEVERFLDVFPSLGDDKKGTGELVDLSRSVRRDMESGNPVPWKDWAKLASGGVAKASREAFEPVQEAAAAHDRHPGLRADVASAIKLVFSLAGRTMEEYQEYKKTHGMMDFPDQEMYALELLEREDVRDRLSHELDLVLVDEFQDTSPIQLSIFLKLSSVARRSVWVGDQKQAIFGFRGTDPSLIDAAVEKLSAGTEPETLPNSWRSRPDLVNLTSELFVPPFASVGIPEARVRLKPAVEEPAGGLGEIVEHWVLDSGNKPNDVLALAEGVARLIADGVRVRDPDTGAARLLRPGDIAILCWQNTTCRDVTEALESRGIRVCIPRPGLMSTLEGRLTIAGLRLWADPGDTLAEAEIAYITEYPGDGDAWLTRVVEAAGEKTFGDCETVADIHAAREARPGASPVEAVDAVMEAVRAVEACHRWGTPAPRLANLEKLRAHAVSFQSTRIEEGSASTLVGFYQHLVSLAAEPADNQGEASGPDAVTVSSWHRAKGLEWPVTILFELDHEPRENAALGVHALTDGDTMNLDDPLAGRWIRYWPYPYGAASKGIPFNERLQASVENTSAVEKERREHMRLLYVGWTRARDRLVLAARKTKLSDGMLSLLKADDSPGIVEPEGEDTVWAGIPIRLKRREVSPDIGQAAASTPEPMLPEGVPREYPPAVINPSALKLEGTAGEPVVIGDPMRLSGTPEWADLGTAVHGFFAADRDSYSPELRREIAQRLLEGWGVASCLNAESLLEMSSRLRSWIDSSWPVAGRSAEIPLMMLEESGSVMTGTADMVLDLGDRLVLIDHKTFPGSRSQAVEVAAGYAGQLGAYRRMLEAATGKPVIACFIHCPVSGIMVPVS